MNAASPAPLPAALAYLGRIWKIDPDLLEAARLAQEETRPERAACRQTARINQLRVLEAFQAAGVGEHHFYGTTGYGLHDEGRQVLDQVVARLFGAPAALVRGQFVSGTHALKCMLYGWLDPGDEWISVTGPPYDTLLPIIGHKEDAPGTLTRLGVVYREAPLDGEGRPSLDRVAPLVGNRTKLFFIQRSCGYTWRPSLDIAALEELMAGLRRLAPQALILVDNCYGELVEDREPTQVGADVVGGSLIKNLGGTLAPTGGYLAGRSDAVAAASRHLTAPGIGALEGATLGMNRVLLQGLFQAPLVVGQALEGSIWAAALFGRLGFEVRPPSGAARTDLILGIRVGSPRALKLFCQGVQKAGAVDSRAVPEEVMAPGYRDPIVMAGGTFIQGSSLELSADGPLREPYCVYLQGGICLAQVQAGALLGLQELRRVKE